MLYDFTFYNPTKIYFGKTAMSNLPSELKNYGENVLLLYGKNSIKKIGLYDEVVRILKECGKTVVELAGINPNPRYSQVLQGAKLVREHGVHLILAVGGGSVIDCAKAISVAAYAEGDAWQKYWIDFQPVTHKLVPVASILTMTGTATATNATRSSRNPATSALTLTVTRNATSAAAR
jgi:alcohol dehydrogenase YqhD (iron-dependent ADH family)